MMNIQWLVVSMILIVLSLVHINASKYQLPRQTTNSPCPDVNLCNYVQCQNGAACVENKTSTACYQCQCLAGFTGSLCETPIPQPSGCASPCLNGGTCNQTVTNIYFCVCPAEYTGSQCETSVLATHPCVTMPTTVCQNGATCTINGAGYLCNCPVGWSGTNCEIQDSATTCDANTCGAYGTCAQIILPNGELTVYCTCQAQWTGKFCDVNLAGPTTTTPTVPLTTTPTIPLTTTPTVPLTTTPTIPLTTTPTIPLTTPLFTTTITATGSTMGSCTASSCLNGGSCYNTGNDFICFCKPQFSGPTCAIASSPTTPNPTTSSNIDACASNPCNNGGVCYKYSNSFVCVCTAQYTGQTCDSVKTTSTPSAITASTGPTCANQPCQNGATCYNAGSSYYCYCGTGSSYTGTNCETLTVAANPSCPLNCSPGYCVLADQVSNTYACMCPGNNGNTLTPNNCLPM